MVQLDELINTRFPVEGMGEQGWIELQDFMPRDGNGDLAIVNAARVSFLGESKGPEADKKLLFYLMRHRHTSPFEMVEVKLRVRAPLVTWWQWVRHRTFSANAQSGRYSPFEEDSFYIPEEWRKQSVSNKQASDGVIEPVVADSFNSAIRNHYYISYKLYKEALDAGIAKEQARLFLPGFSVYYTWVLKVDAHNLMHFLKLRMAQEAQYEIRVYAEAIYNNIFKPLLPWTAEAFELYVLNKENG